MSDAPNIFLVGPMGCGKSALGEHLGARLDREFFDSDEIVRRSAGMTIAEIFEREGERRFRERETEAIAELTGKRGIVLATGGGSVLAEENRRRLCEGGTVVYLRADIATRLARVVDARANSRASARADAQTSSRGRPLLDGRDKRAAMEELDRHREAHYRQIADIVLDVDNKSIRDIGDELIEAASLNDNERQ